MTREPATRPRRRHDRAGRNRKPLLLFFYSPTSGPSRRMDGLISWLYVQERKRLRLRRVDLAATPHNASRFGIATVPTLLLVKGGRIVVRLEGRATGKQIQDAVRPHLTA